MASRKENLKALFTNTKTRVIIVFTAVLLMTAVIIGYFKLTSTAGTGAAASADIAMVPGDIRSIPGALDPTPQYAKLVQQQNVSQAEVAMKKGTSAIPTIVKMQQLGEGVGAVGVDQGQLGVGFAALQREEQQGELRDQWIKDLKNGNCTKEAITQVMGEGASLAVVKAACGCIQLKNLGYTVSNLQQACSCKEMKAAGVNASQLKAAGYSAGQLRRCGFDACQLRAAGFTAQQMADGGFSDGELKGAGFSNKEIADAAGLPDGITADDVRKAGCGVEALTRLRNAGVSASAVRKISGCSAEQLKAAGYTANDLHNAGFTAADLKKAGFTPEQLKNAGYTAKDLLDAGYTPDDLKKAGFTPDEINAAVAEESAEEKAAKNGDCSVASLEKAREAGISATAIKRARGCSAEAMKAAGYSAKDLKDAGFTAAELKNAGFSAKDLKNAGFSPKELKDAGFTAKDLKDAGFDAKALKEAGFNAKDLKDAGFDAKALKDAGFNAKDLKAAGFTAQQLKNAGFSAKQLKNAGFSPTELKNAGFSAAQLKDAGFDAKQLKAAGFTGDDLKKAGFSDQEIKDAGFDQPQSMQQPGQAGLGSGLAGIPGLAGQDQSGDARSRQLQAIMARQNQRMDEQRFQQKIQQRTSNMASAANQALQSWSKVEGQTYIAGSEKDGESEQRMMQNAGITPVAAPANTDSTSGQMIPALKAGDVVFAVMDTSVNSDEPSPILATIVTGKLKGSKLIGSFNLPSNSDKMVITFNTLSMPGAGKTISVNAYAIDPNTARTALSSRTDHHYLLRYGSLFASSFLEGFGNAFQSADTTITVGGSGTQNIQVQNGINRSALENAVIGLATVGKTWGQQVQTLFNRPTTVEVYSGTGVGILFTQDVSLPKL